MHFCILYLLNLFIDFFSVEWDLPPKTTFALSIFRLNNWYLKRKNSLTVRPQSQIKNLKIMTERIILKIKISQGHIDQAISDKNGDPKNLLYCEIREPSFHERNTVLWYSIALLRDFPRIDLYHNTSITLPILETNIGIQTLVDIDAFTSDDLSEYNHLFQYKSVAAFALERANSVDAILSDVIAGRGGDVSTFVDVDAVPVGVDVVARFARALVRAIRIQTALVARAVGHLIIMMRTFGTNRQKNNFRKPPLISKNSFNFSLDPIL